MKKRVFSMLMALVMIVTVLCVDSSNVSAANKKEDVISSADCYSTSDETVLQVGTNIYYYLNNGSWINDEDYIMCYNIKTKKKKKIIKIDHYNEDSWTASISMKYYDGYLYYWVEEMGDKKHNELFRYNIKTKKTKRLISSVYEDSRFAYHCFNIINNRIYYCYYDSKTKDEKNTMAYFGSMDLNGKRKKTIYRAKDIDSIFLSGTSMYFWNQKNATFCVSKNGKKKAVSELDTREKDVMYSYTSSTSKCAVEKYRSSAIAKYGKYTYGWNYVASKESNGIFRTKGNIEFYNPIAKVATRIYKPKNGYTITSVDFLGNYIVVTETKSSEKKAIKKTYLLNKNGKRIKCLCTDEKSY